MKFQNLLSSVAILALSTGCTMLGPDFKLLKADVPENWTAENYKEINSKDDRHESWWKNFNDPVLEKLITEGYENNLGLQITALRIYEARALLGKAKGLQYPQSQALRANATHVEMSRNADPISNLPNSVANDVDDSFQNIGFGVDAFWEMDFWGKYRRGIEAGGANLAATMAGYDDVLVTLTGDIASAYLMLRTFEERKKVVNANISLQERSLKIAQTKFDAGISSELDVQQAKTILFNSKSILPSLDKAIILTRNSLSVLLGRAPGDLADIMGQEGSFPEIPENISVGIPGELLRRRPDVRIAELQAAVQCAKIGVTKADLYPSFRLLGSVGYVADSTDNLVGSNSVTGVGGFGIMWNFLNYGRIKNNVRVADAQFQQAITQYQMTILAAAKEVDDALSSYVYTKQETTLRAQSTQSAKRAVELAMKLYKDGVTSYTTVIETQRTALIQEDAYIGAKGQVALDIIAAYKAMGGGWQLRKNDDYLKAETKTLMAERTDWGDYIEKQEQ
jgi:NodT family efflux transporter outer membrane factor (OMF) lipoprotein